MDGLRLHPIPWFTTVAVGTTGTIIAKSTMGIIGAVDIGADSCIQLFLSALPAGRCSIIPRLFEL